MKKAIIAVIIIVCFVGVLRWYNRPDNGIHALGKNVCLIEGECVVINWGASPREAELALEKWWELRQKEG